MDEPIQKPYVEMQLITQSLDHVTIAAGRVPLLDLNELGVRCCAILSVNFLRSGCPKVQALFSQELSITKDHAERQLREIRTTFRAILGLSQQSAEVLSITEEQTHLDEPEVSLKLFTITRTTK